MFGSLTERNIKDIIKKEKLTDVKYLIKYIEKNPKLMDVRSMYQVAQYANCLRLGQKPFYTDESLLNSIYKRLPNIRGKELTIVDPLCGVGIFLPLIIEKYGDKNKLSITFYDVDNETINIARALSKMIKLKVTFGVSFQNADFLMKRTNEPINLLIGDFPNIRMSHPTLRKKYPSLTKENKLLQSFAPLYLMQSKKWAKYIVTVLTKNFLSTNEYEELRNDISKFTIDHIVDLDTLGYNGISNENIIIFANLAKKVSMSNTTVVYSAKFEKLHEINQRFLTSKTYPNWILYRNTFFNSIARRMNFNSLNIMKNSIPQTTYNESNSVWLIQPLNLNNKNKYVKNNNGTDLFVSLNLIKPNTNLAKTLERKDLYILYMNTNQISVVPKPANVAVSDKLYMLEPLAQITEKDLEFFNSKDFRHFYQIATNFSSRSSSVDTSSVFYFGLLQEDDVETNKKQSETQEYDFSDDFDIVTPKNTKAVSNTIFTYFYPSIARIFCYF